MKLFFVGRSEALVPFDRYRLVSLRPTIKALFITTAVFNTLLMIPDFLNITGPRAVAMGVMRSVYTLLVLGTLWRIKRIRSFRAYAALVTCLEVIALIVFDTVFTLYPAPDFSIQVLGIMVIIMLIYLTPNSWVMMNAVALAGIAGFLACSLWLVQGIDASNMTVGVIYLSVIAALCAIFSLNVRAHQYREYVSREDLKRDYVTDPLTHLGNRIRLEEDAAKWMDRAEKYGMVLSLVVMDVDNMKLLNDTYGHVQGDQVLCQLADVLRAELRRDDVCVRWGGDEFIMLLPYIRGSDAEKLTLRIQRAICAQVFDPPVILTCSFGVAPMQPGMSLTALIAKADEMMYTAKREGKNATRRAKADSGTNLPA
jgi:diguanylate cyclase (GGDEF)-like protein